MGSLHLPHPGSQPSIKLNYGWLTAQSSPANTRHRFDPWVRTIPWRRSDLAWRIPRTEEPGGLQSMGSQKLGRT